MASVVRYFRNQRKTPPPMVREVAKRSTERVAGLIPFGDATEDLVEEDAKSSPGESDKLVEAVSVVDVAPVARNTRTSRKRLRDHGRDLTGLGDDDHPLYYHLDGIRALRADVPLGAATRNFTYGDDAVTAVQIQANANATQYLVLKTSSAGFAPYLTCEGNLDNQDLKISPKGTGDVIITNLEFAGTVTWGSAGNHHDRHDSEDGDDALDCAAPLELASVQATGEGSAHTFARSDHAHQIQHSIADNHLVTIDGSPNDDEYARFTADGIEGRTEAEFKTDFNLNDGDIDHGSTGGLGDDDHTQYLLANGSRNLTSHMLCSQDTELHFRTSDQYVASTGVNVLEIGGGSSVKVTANAILQLEVFDGVVEFGSAEAGVDFRLHFDGETNNGNITFMEDEARFDFDSDVDVAGDITLTGTVDGRDVAADGGVLDTAVLETDVDAKGDIFVATADDTVTRLAVGNDDEVLTADSNEASGVKWAVPAGPHSILDGSVHSDSVADAVTRGSLIYGNATPKWDELVVGLDGQYLGTDGTDVAWQGLDIVDDTTPELGGELDAGAHSIVFTQQTATGDGGTTVDWTLGNKFKFTFGAMNENMNFTPPSDSSTLTLMLIQDGVGGRTVTWDGAIKWPSGAAPALSTGANAIDLLAFYYDGTDYYGGILQDYS